MSFVWFTAANDAAVAAVDFFGASCGLKIVTMLRNFGWPDEAVLFALATLLVIELRGAKKDQRGLVALVVNSRLNDEVGNCRGEI
ncbi:hypothetical protein D8674_006310 [Pyrus ussuriensis x Pyrus communis]|uniref:Uncharacterized protein n=1 Tax=Pyrus ussuriensis x Pyrus communis TaxID=2448454 RepID=A0A5N5FU80_9ROSA|nr:hypothetical protein D8674_006310 [Pyrus ussuriensis x Pyrus communis]